MDFEALSGAEKVAIVMLSLPEDIVRDFLSQLDDDEIEKALAAVSRMDEIPGRVQKQVLQEFEGALGKSEETVVHGGRKQALALVEHVLEGPRAQKILENLGRDEKRIDWTLRSYQPEFIAERIGAEHPQTVALVLSQLPAPRGAKVIESLPAELRSDVILRLANLESVSTEVMSDLEVGLTELFDRRPVSTTRVGGPKVAASVLNRVKKEQGSEILEQVGVRDAEAAVSIRKRMLSFDDLASIDRRGFQVFLREVPAQSLAVALKTASEEMREKVYSNLSSRAVEQIREEMELLGPMRLSDVEKVQEEIVETARRLEAEGRLTLDLGGSDDVLV
jgi:flagellar motor switch protein FliG